MKANEIQKKLLVVEDDPGLQKQLRWSFDDCNVAVASDRESALAQIRRHEPAVVTMDLGLPPDPDGATEGLATLQQILALAPDTKVIVLTGNQNHENALKAIDMGAYDFHQKPLDAGVLNLIVNRAFYLHRLQRENYKLQQAGLISSVPGFITGDPEIARICQQIERIASSDVAVALLGESGTGKEVLAKALHLLSGRNSKRMVAVNCAAIPESLLEAELFGYEKGAFTNAAKQTLGKIETAQGGTFFLDEVGDLPLSLQAKLLRFLQERVIERIGGREEIPVDVRIICATHQDLKKMIDAGTFREDLFYRLCEISIHIPPVRERIGDAVLLAHHFKNQYRIKEKRQTLNFSQDALNAISNHRWPGNVREIENCIKRAVIMAESSQITAQDLGLQSADNPEQPATLREVREQAEREVVAKALARMDGNIVKAAELLGVTRPTLYDLMNRHGLK
ncbi:two-component system, NtrC family, response regulator [Nitrosomonas eutropha]|uniref:PEP-CTERM-box response regulator transcription factor n=1 Tax=Nitrosomonas TaxID=914 RepID=UPI00089AD7D3|nr:MULTISPECIES: PEP-CTERM-box response regulator transcription factor [Nitrosomonas]MXS80566.1 PEP-CTERM-box response regulator transcription factor [Nitrosomonas sp. GH22]SDW79108.1 two-component system, NtrC family, response regulator [Nitrosomonas eutropha]